MKADKQYKHDMNGLAACITEVEGKKVSISIAQVKEVLRILADLSFWNAGVLDMIEILGRENAIKIANKTIALKKKRSKKKVSKKRAGR